MFFRTKHTRLPAGFLEDTVGPIKLWKRKIDKV